jgi:protocatechuate 3,4-dioxygenase beta subunit
MILRARSVLLLAMACGASATGQQPPRDTPHITDHTSSISGTVFVGGEPTQPARRVRVTLTDVTWAAPGQTTTTDDHGAFAFRGLPAGRFELQAFKNAYLRASYGTSRPDRPGVPVVVKDGEAVTNLAMTIVRGGVITGTVRDTRGRPVPGVTVRVLKLGYNAVTGERTLGAPSSGSAAVTDDRGEYRAYGLPPGGYLVLVAPASTSGRSNVPIRQLTTEDVRMAWQAARAGASTAAPPPRPSLSSSSARVNDAPVFYPSATDIRAAATIPLGLSEERAGVDVTIQLVPTATISGTITAPGSALPAFLTVRLVPGSAEQDMLAGAGLRGLSTQPAADGTYSFSSVAPGNYTIRATVGGGRGAPPNVSTQGATAEVNVDGQDLDVPLTLQPGVAINGRVVFEGSHPTPAELQTLSFGLVPPGSGGEALRNGGGRVDAEGRFTFAGVMPDAYHFVMTWTAPGAGDKWTITSSTGNGREAFESPLRVNPNEALEWTVTLTETPTTLTGVLTDAAGRPATDYYVLVFSSDHGKWVPGSRRIRMTRPATDGSFTIKGLPPGEYLLAAPTDLESGEWNDPVLLDQLAPSSLRVVLRDGETTRRDLRIGG